MASVHDSVQTQFEAGKKWKALCEEDKKPFVEQASKLKAEWKVVTAT